MFNTEQIAEMTREEVEAAINKLDGRYNLDRIIVKYTDDIDQVVNVLCDLNRRIETITAAEGYEKAAITLRANKHK